MEFIVKLFQKLYYAFCIDGDELNNPQQNETEESQNEEENNDNHS